MLAVGDKVTFSRKIDSVGDPIKDQLLPCILCGTTSIIRINDLVVCSKHLVKGFTTTAFSPNVDIMRIPKEGIHINIVDQNLVNQLNQYMGVGEMPQPDKKLMLKASRLKLRNYKFEDGVYKILLENGSETSLSPSDFEKETVQVDLPKVPKRGSSLV